MPLNAREYLNHIAVNTRLLAQAARRGTDVPVPQCAGWTVGHVVVHVGRAFRWIEEVVRARAQDPLLPRTNDHSFDRLDPGLIPWFEDAFTRFDETMRQADPEEPVWSWAGDNRVAFWQRLMAHELAVHRTDAQSAFGQPDPVDATLARDTIDGLMELFLPRERRSMLPSKGERFLFTEANGPGVWLVQIEPTTVIVNREPGEADVTARGNASDLMLFLWQRTGPEKLGVEGRAQLLDRYRELVPLP